LRLPRNQRESQSQKQDSGKTCSVSHPRYYSKDTRMGDTTQLRKLTAHVKAAG
jgi:hypothetical protein